eukprot:m.196673 g.196673  ORF g.196673 m.196673 type:complete len:74 (+) comp17016_c0_seq12:92-313(+)
MRPSTQVLSTIIKLEPCDQPSSSSNKCQKNCSRDLLKPVKDTDVDLLSLYYSKQPQVWIQSILKLSLQPNFFL